MDKMPYTAEYGSELYEQNRSTHTIMQSGVHINPHGVEFPCEFYHRSRGYMPAGSCGRWTEEIWGYHIYYKDGTTGGKFWRDPSEAFNYWNGTLQIVSKTDNAVKG